MKRLLSSALITTAVVALTACSAGSSRPTSAPSIDPDALMISAKDLKFSTSTLAAPANTPFQIAFDNQESAPHNVAISAMNNISVRSCSALSARGSGNSEKHSANRCIGRSLQIRSYLQNHFLPIWQLLVPPHMRFPCPSRGG